MKGDDDPMTTDEMRPDIAEAWQKMPNKTFKKKPTRKLAELLNAGETVLRMTGGRVAGTVGLVVATDRRVMFISEAVGKHTFEDFPYDRITTVTSSGGFVQGKVVITTAGASRVIDRIDKGDADAFGAIVRERVEATTRERHDAVAAGRHTAPPRPGTASLAQELRGLAELRDQGILTPQEFDAQKRRLLGG